jgi:hypothetical protein
MRFYCSQFHAPAALLLGETVPYTRCLGGWVSPRDGLEALDQNFLPRSRIELRFLGHPTRSLVAIPTVYSKSQI